MGDQLVVALTGDKSVNKGPGRPVFDQNQRAAVLWQLACVDQVIIYDGPWPESVIRIVHPAIFCKGIDYAGKKIPERALVEQFGGVVVFTETQKYSSTKLLEMI